MLRPEQIWQPRMGAPLGNRNRLRHGNQTRAMKELRRLVAQWRRETAALLAPAACQLASGAAPATLPSQGPVGDNRLAKKYSQVHWRAVLHSANFTLD